MCESDQSFRQVEGETQFFLIFLILFLLAFIEGENTPNFHISGAEVDSCNTLVERFALASIDDPQSVLKLMEFSNGQENNYLESLLNYFNIQRPEDIIWAHGVDNQGYLNQVIQSCVHILEVDIIDGRIGHSLSSPENISITDFLQQIKTSRQGLKLDFKDVHSIAEVLEQLRQADFSQPLVINMDVLAGPGGNNKLSDQELQIFVEQIKQYPGTMISLGWSSGNYISLSYSFEMIEEMIELIEENNLENYPLTFAVNFFHLPGSHQALEYLLARFPDATLTVFYTRDSPIGVEALQFLDDFDGRIFRDFQFRTS